MSAKQIKPTDATIFAIRFARRREGYWKDLLGDNPYHISALYVVDLVKFRANLVGDHLRATYESLSADPNSLSNLDQGENGKESKHSCACVCVYEREREREREKEAIRALQLSEYKPFRGLLCSSQTSPTSSPAIGP